MFQGETIETPPESVHPDDTSIINHGNHPPPLPSEIPLEDEFDIVGKNVAAKLRQIPRTQRIFAEKLINEVLFEAQLGTLNRDCKLVLNSLNTTHLQETREEQQLYISEDIKPFL